MEDSEKADIDLEVFASSVSKGAIDLGKYLKIKARVSAALENAVRENTVLAAEREIVILIFNKFVRLSSDRVVLKKLRKANHSALAKLAEKGNINSKMRQALAELGIIVKDLKRSKNETVKDLYERMYNAADDVDSDDNNFIHFVASKAYRVAWTTRRDKRFKIIAILREEFGYKSDTAVIDALRKIKTANLPGKKLSGREHPSHRL